MRQNYLTLREALASHRLDALVRQEETRGVELVNGSELERALALLITIQRRPEARSFRHLGAARDESVFARVEGEAQSRIGIVTAQVPRPSLGLIGLAPNLQRDDRVWRIDAAC